MLTTTGFMNKTLLYFTKILLDFDRIN